MPPPQPILGASLGHASTGRSGCGGHGGGCEAARPLHGLLLPRSFPAGLKAPVQQETDIRTLLKQKSTKGSPTSRRKCSREKSCERATTFYILFTWRQEVHGTFNFFKYEKGASRGKNLFIFPPLFSYLASYFIFSPRERA